MDDKELTRLAEEELLREAKRGEARAAVHGVMGWLKDKTPRTNKRFLSNTISNALQHNHRQRSIDTQREATSSHQIEEKLKRKAQNGPSHETEQTDDKKIKKSRKHKKSKSHKTDVKKIKKAHKHKKSKSRHNHNSHGLSNDDAKSGYHKPKHKKRKVEK